MVDILNCGHVFIHSLAARWPKYLICFDMEQDVTDSKARQLDFTLNQNKCIFLVFFASELPQMSLNTILCTREFTPVLTKGFHKSPKNVGPSRSALKIGAVAVMGVWGWLNTPAILGRPPCE